MRGTINRLDGVLHLVSYVIGSAVLVLAGAAYFTRQSPADLAALTERVFGTGFLVVYGFLLVTGLLCWRCQTHAPDNPFWSRAALQAASGIATLALTFTLLGISLGIGSLADQRLSPETVHEIIGELTAQFSMAFMTTVVGLPTAAALRALVILTGAWRDRNSPQGDPS